MAALVALLMKSRRTALDMAVYQRRISAFKTGRSRSLKKDFELIETHFISFLENRNQSLSYGNFVKKRLRFPSI